MEKGYLTYEKILNYDLEEFLDFMDQNQLQINMDVKNVDNIARLTSLMSSFADTYQLLNSLLAYAIMLKRLAKRDYDKSKSLEDKYHYEDLLDREKIINETLKAVDIQYRAVSKMINVILDDKKENKYLN